MQHPVSRPPLATLAVALALAMASPAGLATAETTARSVVIEDVTGEWKDGSGAKGRMRIESKTGLLFINGSDSRSEYQAACVPSVAVMTCKGHGISRSGHGFLYENSMRLTKEGTLVEAWFVQGSAEDAAGRTEWSRK